MSVPKTPVPPSLDGLVDLACRSGVDIRPTLLRVLTDLYVQKKAHTAAEMDQYIELAERLIEAVDPTTRSIVAARLALYPSAPAGLLQRLVELGALPEMPVLTLQAGQARSPSSSSAPASAPAHSPAPAQEPTLAPTLKSTLAPAKSSSENELAALFFGGDADLRKTLLVNLDAGAGEKPLRPAANLADLSRSLEAAALQRNPEEFARILVRSLAIERAMAMRIADDASGEPIVVIAKAIGMKADALQRVLLFLNPKIGTSVERVYQLAELFNQVGTAACQTMLDALRDAGTRRRPDHQPVYYDDERSSARNSATPDQRPVARPRVPLLERYRGNGR